jgi:hypothetical protein
MKFLGCRRNKALSQDIAVPPPVESAEPGLPPAEKQLQDTTDYDGTSIEAPSEDAQEGVKKVEAVTLTWTRNELIMAYGL